MKDYGQIDSSTVASKNFFAPMTDGQMPVFDRFANSSLGVSYNGIGSVLDPSNQFVFPILRAESTTISVNDAKTEDDQSTEVEISGE